MKNIKKLLALMLALVMIFALVACDDKKSSDTEEEETVTEEKKDEDKEDAKTAEKEEEDKKTEADSVDLEGEWLYSVDMSEAFGAAMGEIAEQIDLPDEKVMMNLSFEFEDDEFTLTVGVDKEDFEDYLDALVDVMLEYMYDMAESQGMSKDDFDAQFSAANGAGVEDYLEESMKAALEEAGDQLSQSKEGYYKVDTKKGRIYIAEDEDDLDDAEDYMEYELSGKKLTITKVISDGEEANPVGENLDILEFPWTFKKQ